MAVLVSNMVVLRTETFLSPFGKVTFTFCRVNVKVAHADSPVSREVVQVLIGRDGPDGFVPGVAVCNPSDSFDAEIGRKLAFKRAVAVCPPAERADLWESYHKAYQHAYKTERRSLGDRATCSGWTKSSGLPNPLFQT